MALRRWFSGLSPLTLIVGSLGVIIFVPFTVRTFAYEAFKIPAPSMVPTLMVGDRIFVSKSAYGFFEHRVPARGDVIVFRFPEHPDQDFVKRVVGLPGDEIVVKGVAVYINGWKVPSCTAGRARLGLAAAPHDGEIDVEFIDEKAFLVFHDEAMGPKGFDGVQGPYQVAPREVFVFGDSRENSYDSRLWFEGRGGGVPIENIKGRASIVWMSFDPNGVVGSRIGMKIGETPVCPEGFPPATRAGLARCLANRPSRDASTPPNHR